MKPWEVHWSIWLVTDDSTQSTLLAELSFNWIFDNRRIKVDHPKWPFRISHSFRKEEVWRTALFSMNITSEKKVSNVQTLIYIHLCLLFRSFLAEFSLKQQQTRSIFQSQFWHWGVYRKKPGVGFFVINLLKECNRRSRNRKNVRDQQNKIDL